MLFKDREDAGQKLAPLLSSYLGRKDVIVIGLARGGLSTAFVIAEKLKLPLDAICIRKLGAPQYPELALGAISKTGDVFLNEDLIERLGVPQSYLKAEMASQRELAEKRDTLYHKTFPSLEVKGKVVILVDDGLATGATMKSAIQSMRSLFASRIVVAVPVAAEDSLVEVQALADEVVCPSVPPYFQAVGQFYQEFYQVEDDEVIALLERSKI